MLRRRASDRLAFDINPGTVVSAVIVFDCRDSRPGWVVAHPSLDVTEELAAGAELTALPSSPASACASADREVFVGLREIGNNLEGIVLDMIRIGDTPSGFVTIIPPREDMAQPGRELVLFIVGFQSGFLRFTA
jgi:hypothetical protein